MSTHSKSRHTQQPPCSVYKNVHSPLAAAIWFYQHVNRDVAAESHTRTICTFEAAGEETQSGDFCCVTYLAGLLRNTEM